MANNCEAAKIRVLVEPTHPQQPQKKPPNSFSISHSPSLINFISINITSLLLYRYQIDKSPTSKSFIRTYCNITRSSLNPPQFPTTPTIRVNPIQLSHHYHYPPQSFLKVSTITITGHFQQSFEKNDVTIPQHHSCLRGLSR